jgi:hypothetical protein
LCSCTLDCTFFNPRLKEYFLNDWIDVYVSLILK